MFWVGRNEFILDFMFLFMIAKSNPLDGGKIITNVGSGVVTDTWWLGYKFAHPVWETLEIWG